MASSLKERFEQLEHIQGAARAPSGSSVVLILRLSHPPGKGLPETIPATRALVRRGMAVPKAKQAIEALLDNHEVTVDLPSVDDADTMIAELAASGINATLASSQPVVNSASSTG